MKKLAINLTRTLAVVISIAITIPTHTMATDRVPQQFVGSWCADQTPTTWEEEVIYNRSNTCKSAHEPEDQMILRPDRLLISDAFECKFLEIVSITRHGTHRLKFWCKSNDNEINKTRIYEIFVSVLQRNKLAVQEVPAAVE